jgi:hypothetical protein
MTVKKRLTGLIEELKKLDPPLKSIPFYVLGGECNYLLKMDNKFQLKQYTEDWNPLQTEGEVEAVILCCQHTSLLSFFLWES